MVRVTVLSESIAAERFSREAGSGSCETILTARSTIAAQRIAPIRRNAVGAKFADSPSLLAIYCRKPPVIHLALETPNCRENLLNFRLLGKAHSAEVCPFALGQVNQIGIFVHIRFASRLASVI